LRKAAAFRDTVLQRGRTGTPVHGATPNVFRYAFNGKYIDLEHIMGVDLLGVPVRRGVRIISFGTQ